MKHKALEMIKKGYSEEIVMDVLGLEPNELLDIINEKIKDMIGKVHMVEYISQIMYSTMLGKFEININ
jgi:hypothetical protein